MKLNKFLLASAMFVAPLTIITPTVVSCKDNNVFEAHVKNKLFTTSDRTVSISFSFSYSPSKPVPVYLEGEGVDDLSYPNDIKIKNNKAKLDINISGALAQSKLFKFSIKFLYDTLSEPFVLNDFYIVYQFEPEQRDIVMLRTPSIVETTENKCIFKIQFSAQPTSVGGQIETELSVKTYTTDRMPIYYDDTQTIEVEGSKYYLNFEIGTYGSFVDDYFFSTFDLILTFRNSYQHEQIEVIPNCVYTHLI